MPARRATVLQVAMVPGQVDAVAIGWTSAPDVLRRMMAVYTEPSPVGRSPRPVRHASPGLVGMDGWLRRLAGTAPGAISPAGRST
ncbi:MAG: hypothetical protein AVDCRST_MAG33-160 [uncultured Thermomicrobiales bacterium]|uniref:Uncharacterized protein n=1 Tax=uncultured Thermomicrobiales bacterium TaxID=1645740 RepID=A0A6J4U9X8_9BACT|nr:MAG: hypothetical protein AVDCRST_MAG33-160 [uncultured Thermomicrobiales bacterium]